MKDILRRVLHRHDTGPTAGQVWVLRRMKRELDDAEQALARVRVALAEIEKELEVAA